MDYLHFQRFLELLRGAGSELGGCWEEARRRGWQEAGQTGFRSGKQEVTEGVGGLARWLARYCLGAGPAEGAKAIPNFFQKNSDFI